MISRPNLGCSHWLEFVYTRMLSWHHFARASNWVKDTTSFSVFVTQITKSGSYLVMVGPPRTIHGPSTVAWPSPCTILILPFPSGVKLNEAKCRGQRFGWHEFSTSNKHDQISHNFQWCKLIKKEIRIRLLWCQTSSHTIWNNLLVVVDTFAMFGAMVLFSAAVYPRDTIKRGERKFTEHVCFESQWISWIFVSESHICRQILTLATSTLIIQLFWLCQPLNVLKYNGGLIFLTENSKTHIYLIPWISPCFGNGH